MTNKKIILSICGIIALMFFSTLTRGQIKETFESVVKNAISQGVIKKDGYKITYIASPGQDTAKIRTYYQGLIGQTGKPYQFYFQSNATVIQPTVKNIAKSNTIIQPKPQNNDSPYAIAEGNNNGNQPMVPSTTTGTPGNPVATVGCWTKQKVFGKLHFTDNVEEYTFVIPSDITNIKIEAWSGGGNGYSEFITQDEAYGLKKIVNVRGGGGGGGAYANAIINVKKGDQVLISIPSGGGGKSVQVRLNNTDNIFYLNNGADGKPDGLFAKGMGGGSGGVYGIFKEKLFWLEGGQGEVIDVKSYVFNDGGGHDFGQERGPSWQWLAANFGRGGNAALLSNGGRETIIGDVFHQTNDAPSAGNGGFPGGGGGGGTPVNYAYAKAGKGAPGMVIIHY